MGTGIKTAVAYARYSSDNQRQESIDAQVRAIEDYCKKNKIILSRTYVDEAVSATTDQREEFLRMVEDAKKGGFQLCIVHKLDRFARNRYDSAFYRRELEKCGVKVVSVLEQLDDSPESIILESVLEGMAEYYSKNLAREVRKGLNENALSAKHNGGIPPLGYNVTPDRGYEINREEAPAVRLIFEMYSKGYGYALICNELNSRGYKTKAGRAFGKGSIAEIIRNEKYIGRYVWNKRLSKKSGNHQYKPDDQITRIEGALPAIITKETWDRTQAILNSRRRKSRHNQSYFYLLTGKLVCADCGSAYVGSGYAYGRGKKKNYQYACNGRARRKCECVNKPIRCEKIESFVLSKIRAVLSESIIQQLAEQVCEKLNHKFQATAGERESILNQIEKVRDKIAKTWDLYYDNMLSKENASSQVNKLTDQQKGLEDRLARLDSSVGEPIVSKGSIIAYLRKCRENLESNDKDVLRQLVEAFVGEVVVSEDSITAQIRISPKANADSDKVGGDEGNRTPVRRLPTRAFYECSRCFNIPSAQRPSAGSVLQ